MQRIDAQGAPAEPRVARPGGAIEGAIVEPLLKIEAPAATPWLVDRRALPAPRKRRCLRRGGSGSARTTTCGSGWRCAAKPTAIDQPLACVRVHDSNDSQDRSGASVTAGCACTRAVAVVGTPRLRALCRRQQARFRPCAGGEPGQPRRWSRGATRVRGRGACWLAISALVGQRLAHVRRPVVAARAHGTRRLKGHASHVGSPASAARNASTAARGSDARRIANAGMRVMAFLKSGHSGRDAA